MTKAEEALRRFCYKRSCIGCPFNNSEYSYNEADEEGDYRDICSLEGNEETLQELFDIYVEYKDKPTLDEDALLDEWSQNL